MFKKFLFVFYFLSLSSLNAMDKFFQKINETAEDHQSIITNFGKILAIQEKILATSPLTPNQKKKFKSAFTLNNSLKHIVSQDFLFVTLKYLIQGNAYMIRDLHAYSKKGNICPSALEPLDAPLGRLLTLYTKYRRAIKACNPNVTSPTTQPTTKFELPKTDLGWGILIGGIYREYLKINPEKKSE